METQRNDQGSGPRRQRSLNSLFTPLDIVGDLQATSGDVNVQLHAQGGLITVEINRLPTLRSHRGQRRRRIRFLQLLHAGLQRTAQRMEIKLNGRTAARLGHDVRPGVFSRLVARLFGFGPLELRLTAIVPALLSLRGDSDTGS
ncbi:hypothetical protein [Marinobacterium arenosum]|uniref:hypothetical protein n=1 Tax=Marinobacterium arenosum TaxID=2862496 RepID=UPI001C93756F|nr:hypothetical protein [Marinobacterium arenosum]MBY4677837.1 hypothetical protein [Marinobacterium arenosum]